MLDLSIVKMERNGFLISVADENSALSVMLKDGMFYRNNGDVWYYDTFKREFEERFGLDFIETIKPFKL